MWAEIDWRDRQGDDFLFPNPPQQSSKGEGMTAKGNDVAKLVVLSPCLFHVTYENSLNRIRRVRRLESAAVLMELGGQLDWLRKRRDSMLRFSVDGDPIVLTDQLPIN